MSNLCATSRRGQAFEYHGNQAVCCADGLPFVAGERTVARPSLCELRRAFFAYLSRRRMAEREGFEPSVAFRQRLISSQVPSTTQPPLLQFSEAGEYRVCGGTQGGAYNDVPEFQLSSSPAGGLCHRYANPLCSHWSRLRRVVGARPNSSPRLAAMGRAGWLCGRHHLWLFLPAQDRPDQNGTRLRPFIVDFECSGGPPKAPFIASIDNSTLVQRRAVQRVQFAWHFKPVFSLTSPARC